MKIDLDEIKRVVKEGKLKEVSQETGIPLRTLEDWRYENNKWLKQTTERLTALQKYINLEENKMKTIKWTGQPTNQNMTWKEEANSYRELYEKLVERDIISIVDYDPYEKHLLELNGFSIDDYNAWFEEQEELYYNDEIDELPEHDVYEWLKNKVENIKDLEDEDYKDLIESEDGNAYYQEFEGGE